MSQENVEIVRDMYEAYAHRDAATPYERYAPDIEWDHRDLELAVATASTRGPTASGRCFAIFSRPFASLSFARQS